MRTITRLGVAVAATALASTTALAGAAAAGAQMFPETGSVAAGDFSTNSPSTLTADRNSAGVTVTYTNRTDSALVCFGASAPGEVVREFDAHVNKYGVMGLAEGPAGELEGKLAKYADDEQMSERMFLLAPDGTSVGVEVGIPIDESFSSVIEPDASRSWSFAAPTGYTAGAFLLCFDPGEALEDPEELLAYVEYVSTTGGAGGGGIFGSLMGSLGS